MPFILHTRLSTKSIPVCYSSCTCTLFIVKWEYLLGVAKVFGNWMTAGAKELLLVIKEVGPLNQTDHCYERSEYTLYKADKTVFDHGK